LSRLRVTARRACRFGTMAPSQLRPSTLSTGLAPGLSKSVDISASTGDGPRLGDVAGPRDR
jgi:hypothetical protein